MAFSAVPTAAPELRPSWVWFLPSPHLILGVRDMHCSCLVEFAATLAIRASVIVEDGNRISSDCLQHAWIANRCLLDRWVVVLKACDESLLALKSSARNEANLEACGAALIRAEATIEEVLIVDVFSRVAGCLMIAIDDRHRLAGEFSGVAHGMLVGQLEARRRATRILGSVQHMTNRKQRRLELLRDRCESVNDGLLAIMAAQGLTKRFHFQSKRCFFPSQPHGLTVWQTGALMTTLRTWMLGTPWTLGANPDWIRRLVEAVSRLVAASCWHGASELRSAKFVELSSPVDGYGAGQLLFAPKSNGSGPLPSRRF